MKILVIQQKMIGDVLISSLLCDNLRKAYPKAQIDYMVYESTTPVLQGNPNFDNLILFQEKHRTSRKELFKLLLSVRKEKYDVVIDAYSKLESWLVTFFSGAEKRISYWKKHTNFLYTHSVKKKTVSDSNLGLIIEQRLALLDPLEIDLSLKTFPEIYVTPEEKDFAKELFSRHGIDQAKQTLMLGITGSEVAKTYPLEHMAKVIDFIAEKGDVNLLFNYIPNQLPEAKQLYHACKETTRAKIYFDLTGNNLREFICIMDNCDMIIGNDGGAINMAKALRKPSFIIFSPWIDKAGWATFEDGINNISVHLQDYKPELFEGLDPKSIKKKYAGLYKEFTPELFASSLNKFLELHLK